MFQTSNIPENVGNWTTIDNSILNSCRSAQLQFIQFTTIRDNESWNDAGRRQSLGQLCVWSLLCFKRKTSEYRAPCVVFARCAGIFSFGRLRGNPRGGGGTPLTPLGTILPWCSSTFQGKSCIGRPWCWEVLPSRTVIEFKAFLYIYIYIDSSLSDTRSGEKFNWKNYSVETYVSRHQGAQFGPSWNHQ